MTHDDRDARWARVGTRERGKLVLLRARMSDFARHAGAPELLMSSFDTLFQQLCQTDPDADRALGHAIEILGSDETLRDGVRRSFARLLERAHLAYALANLGILAAHGLMAELRQRLVRKVLPVHRPEEDLHEMLGVIARDRGRVVWLAKADETLLGEFIELASPADPLVSAALVRSRGSELGDR